MDSKEILYVVVPAYNEEENIPLLVESWYPKLEKSIGINNDFRMIVVDDGSKDGTYNVLCLLKKKYEKLLPLTRSNGGHGAAILYGYRYAIENGADWIFQTDSDGQTNPDEFGRFWRKRSEYAAIIGNRKIRGDGRERKFVEDIVCFLLRLIFGVSIEDANAPFRLMKAGLVNKYIHKLPEDFNIPNIMLTTYFVYFKEKVLFLPISFKAREKGTNSINPKKIIKIGWKAIGDFRKLRKNINNE